MLLTSRDQLELPEAVATGQVRSSITAFSKWSRGWTLVSGVCLLGLFIVAGILSPDPSGLGTHQQLGFPPCGFVVALGRPCPSCGMTTAWSRIVRGDVVASIDANAGGFMLALASMPLGIWLVASGLRGNWFLIRPNPVLLIGYSAATFAASLVQWLTR